MALSYDVVVRRVGLAANAIIGVTSTSITTNYAASPITATNFDGAIFPYNAVTDAVLSAVGRVAQVIADTKEHPYRYWLKDTVAVSNGVQIPGVGTSGDDITGVYGDVRTAGGILFMPISSEEMSRYQRSPNNYGTHLYLYYITDTDVFYATQSTAIIECCVYNRTTQQTALTAHNEVPLPDSLEDVIVAGGIASLNRDGQSADPTGFFSQYFAQALQNIQNGATTLAPLAVNVPLGSAAKAI